MRILNIVSSNLVQDPRVVKQAETIKELTSDYMILGKNNNEATQKRLNKLNFNYKLFGSKKNENNIIKKIIGRIKYSQEVIKFIRFYKPQIIHANDFDTLFMVAMSGYKDAKIVYDAHEIYSKNAFINKYSTISNLVEKIEKRLVKKTFAFITVSNSAKKYYQNKGYKKEAVVITNAPIANEITKNNDNTEKFQVVYQGQIVENRGYEEFLLAGLEIDDNIQLVIRGFGHLKDKLVEIKEDNKINNVIIAPPVEMSDMINELALSHVGVVLTKNTSINFEYTVSNKLFECLHAGLPVILSPVKEHIYLNNIYNFGIVIPEVTPIEISKAIEDLYNDEGYYEKLKLNAKKAAKIFTWQEESKKLSDIYLNSIS